MATKSFREIYQEQKELDVEGPYPPNGTLGDDGETLITDSERALMYFSSRQAEAVERLENDFGYIRRDAVRQERARVAASLVNQSIDWTAKARMALDLVKSADDEESALRIMEKCLRWANGKANIEK